MRKKSFRLTALSLSLIMALGDCGAVFAAETDLPSVQAEADTETDNTDETPEEDEESEAGNEKTGDTDEAGSSDAGHDESENNSDNEEENQDSDESSTDENDKDDNSDVTQDENSDSEVEDNKEETETEENTDSETLDDEDEEQPEEESESEEIESEENEADKEAGRVISDKLEEKLNSLVYGSDGIKHDGVEYITYRAFLSLSDEAQSEYIKMCDEAVDILSLGYNIEDVVIASDTSGELTMGFFVGFEELSEATYEEGTDEEVVSEDKEIPSDADDDSNEVVEINNIDELSEEEKEELGLTSPQSENEDKLDEILAEVEDVEIPADEPLDIVLDLSEVPDANGDEINVQAFDSSLSVYDQNYFYNQLDSDEKDIYNACKNNLLAGKNTVSFSHSYIPTSSFCDALSALMTTYSSSFGWVDKSSNGGFSISRRGCGSSVCSYSLTVQKSRYYNATLASQASSRINTLVKEANEYARVNYPDKPTFGMIYYFDEWLCAHNYYNNAGISGGGNRDSATYYYCHSPYGCLLKGYGVCESYALAMSALLDKAGIPNIYVVGYAGGGHAWNYVYMPNRQWYLQDSTWNDSTSLSHNYSSRGYLLVKKDSRTADGQFYCSGSEFRFPSISTSDYTNTYYVNGRREATPLYDEPLNISKTSLLLKPKATKTLSINKYYTNYKKTWSSDNTTVAKVSSKGKVTAVKPGVAHISCTLGGRTETCVVYVYNISSLKFDNNKKTRTITYKNEDTVFDASDIQTYSVNVRQSGAFTSAENLKSMLGLANPKVSNSKKTVATVSNVRLIGDTIFFDVQPLKIGSTKLTIKFAGKSAVLNLKVKQVLQDDWFYLQYTEKNYKKGKVLKPRVYKNGAPRKVTYSVSYRNNKKPGTATVLIKGKGYYIGTVSKEFTITDY